MIKIKITAVVLDKTSFVNDWPDLPPNVQSEAKKRIGLLLTNPAAGSLRLHDLSDHLPKIWKIDITSGKGSRYQATFHLVGSVAHFLRAGTHKMMDRIYPK